MQIIDEDTIRRLQAEAQTNPRRRMHHNLHRSYDEPCQRLLVAMEPDSYIRPHRHLTPPKPECFLALRGRFAAVTFHDDGAIERVILLAPHAAAAVDIPPGTWHAIVALGDAGVFFETKPGPYMPLSDKDFAPWAPVEGSPEAPGYLAELRAEVERLLETGG